MTNKEYFDIYVAIMYIEHVKSKQRGKVYTQILLRESYREPGAHRSKVKHRTLLNLTKLPEKDIQAMELGLKHKNDISKLKSIISSDLKIKQGRSVGAIWLLNQLAQRTGLIKALGQSREAKLCLWMIMTRLIEQGSRLSSVRLAEEHAACEILNLEGFTEDDLYKSMDWLDKNQAKIEDRLFKQRCKNQQPRVYLYDVTSSYLEGKLNEYAAFGYNRDKKRGKLQIVIGLLTDDNGVPLSVEVFEGNTPDQSTVYSQIRKMAERFNAQSVTMVGDRGMLKTTQIKQLTSDNFCFNYLTAITKPQIETMITNGHFQLGLFDEQVCEVEVDNIRYLLRKNPHRTKQIEESRKEKFLSIVRLIEKKNKYLAEHPRAKVETALKNISEFAQKLKIDKLINIIDENRVIQASWNQDTLKEASRLDGCYVLKTDVSKQVVPDADVLHDRYKDLALVEKAFRSMKTGHLEVRPVYVRKASRTRAHVFTVMLAYHLLRELESAWKNLEITPEEGLKMLSSLCAHELDFENSKGYLSVPVPRDSIGQLFESCQITPPSALPRRQSAVASRQKLTSRRK